MTFGLKQREITGQGVTDKETLESNSNTVNTD